MLLYKYAKIFHKKTKICNDKYKLYLKTKHYELSKYLTPKIEH